MLTRAPRKRELLGEPQLSQPPSKKNRLDKQAERSFRRRNLQEVLDELCLRVESNDRQLTNNLIREIDTEHVRVIRDKDFAKSCTKLIKACLTSKIETVSNKMFACLMGMFARGSLQRRKDFVFSLQEVCEGLSQAIKEPAKILPDPRRIVETSNFDSGAESDTDSEASNKKPADFKPRIEDILPMDEEEDEISMIDALYLKPNLDSGVLTIYTMVLREKIIQADEVPEKIKLCARRSLAYSSISSTANRTAAIDFHVALAISSSSSTSEEESAAQCESLLTRLAGDRDFRVRKSAAEGLLALSNVFKLSKATYQLAKTHMADSDSDIRIAAIKLLIFYANRRGEEEIEGTNKKLYDDAFSSICDAINDIEIGVRVEAAKKLGDFEQVSEELIYQTLDKKMMRSTTNQQVVKVQQSLFALSKKASTNRDRRWKFAKKAPKMQESRGGWSRGKELNASVPSEEEKKKNGVEGAEKNDDDDDNEEEESIIPHGACGAFVSALEDEFMDVRKAAVYSLGRLACTRPTFAVSALEYLADMFNDEMADVRLDAINALTPLIAHGQINSEQLNVISKCLDDAMPEARQAMRELLKRAQFVDLNCIEMCVKALLSCLKRFPKDKDEIYGCMADIGKNHGVQVQSIMRSLLDIHLIFHTRESSIEDQEYVGKLIMVLNAAAFQPSMVHFMPEFVHRHYRFLRNASPNLVRPIRVLDEEKQIGRCSKSDEKTNEKAEEVVMNTYYRLCNVTATAQLVDRNIQRDEIFRDTSLTSSA